MYTILLNESLVQEELKELARRMIEDMKHPSVLSINDLNRSKNSIIVKIKDTDSIQELIEKLHSSFGTNQEMIVKKKAMGRYQDVLEVHYKTKVGNKNIFEIARFAKRLIKDKIPNITDVKSVGSLQNKADIVVTDDEGNDYGISVKMSLDRNIRFEYNKNLGYGNEENSLVPCPKNKPWWLIGRKLFYSYLKRSGKVKAQYSPTEKDIKAPSWMIRAKKEYPDIYKKAITELYGEIRSVFFKKLRKMNVTKLASMINDSRMGNEQERNSYKAFFKLTYDKKGVTLEKVGKGKSDLTGLTPSKVVKQNGSNIVIEIPGMEPLVINSVKFQSSMLSSNKEDLKLKTR